MMHLDFELPVFWKRLRGFAEAGPAGEETAATVRAILADIRAKGDSALCAYTEKFDRAKLRPADLRVPPAELAAAARSLPPARRKAVKKALHCVEDFHRRSLPKGWSGSNPHGATVGEIYHPLERVGLYIPGGRVPLVSTVIMTAGLARLAKVPEVAVTTPPRPDGSIDPGLLAALHICGVREVYKAGGVQAIGALAFGTKTIPAVDKIFGPGNAFVMEAKRQVCGLTGIDLLPGPSEVMVIADGSAEPEWIAADLLAQAEHGTGKEKVYYVTTDPAQVAHVERELRQQRPSLVHAEAIATVLKKGLCIITVPDLAAATAVANFVAPEHLELQVERAAQNRLLKDIRTAGAILLGSLTPTVLGDFTAGPSHVLPTGRTGRAFSGLRMDDFFRRTSFVRYPSKKALREAQPVVRALAELENLDAHGQSLERRLG